ncbi:MAG: DUF1800 domain-containing protein [Acidobacteriota bacterium]
MESAAPKLRSRKSRRSAFGVALAFVLVPAGGAADRLLAASAPQPSIQAPWQEAGLTARQAAAHALDRLAYGARPGEVDQVVALGVDRWIEQQLFESRPSPELDRKLAKLVSLDLTAKEMEATFPSRGAVFRRALREGVIDDPDLIERFQRGRNDGPSADPRPLRADRQPERRLSHDQRQKVIRWARDQGILPQRRAREELTSQKLYRAHQSENQLQEVLSDFWFNHFNVSITDPQARIFVWPYERDAIRPHVLGQFRDMLGATAKHPAMLHYLDNATSVAGDDDETTLDRRLNAYGRRGERIKARLEQRKSRRGDRRPRGLNENYARELMELHTLGVDGGYSQEDVVEVARAFTGWTVYPASGGGGGMARDLRRISDRPEAGFVVEDAFVFRADVHDAGVKTVLGQRLAAGRGIEDGLDVLDLLAAHRSTARHLAGKLAARFIGDAPPAGVVDRLAETFESSGGDLLQIMVTLVESPEFWSPEARGAKIKSPFELAVSALRSVDADLYDPAPLAGWIEKMGQPLYAYQAPTGYPDRAEAWVNTGALLHRMNFGLELAAGRIPGLRFDLLALLGQQEPPSMDEALAAYLPRLLPERDIRRALERLGPMVRDPRLVAKLVEPRETVQAYDISDADTDEWEANSAESRDRRVRPPVPSPEEIGSRGVAHVVGVILGSPEFQRR